MIESYPFLVDDDQIGRTPSGIYLAGSQVGEVAANDTLDSESDVVFTLVGRALPMVPSIQLETALIQSFRQLLESVVHLDDPSKVVSLEDPWVAEVTVPDTDIQIGVRLRSDQIKDYWEVWVRSSEGSLQIESDENARLQFLALSLSARTDLLTEFLPMQLSTIAYEYAERKMTQAYVKAVNGEVVPNPTSAQALAAMKMTHQYILRALPPK